MQYKEAGKIAETIASEILEEHKARLNHEVTSKVGEDKIAHAQILERFERIIDRLKNHARPMEFSTRKLQGSIRG